MHLIKTALSSFSAAHRLIKGYEGKCKHLHGHDYSVGVLLGAPKLNQYGFVIEFSDIKKKYDAWIQDNWDHSTLVSEDDQVLMAFLQENQQKHYVLPGQVNTTVECLTQHLFTKLTEIIEKEKTGLNEQAVLLEVEIGETKSSSAIYGSRGAILHGEFCGV